MKEANAAEKGGFMFRIEQYQGADGHRLSYGLLEDRHREPDGRAMLFIPGLGGSIKGAIDFLEQLLPTFSPIYGPDLRSFGINAQQEPLLHAKNLLCDLGSFHKQVIEPAIDTGKIKELTLCGISLGGVLATHLATRHPNRYKRLILMAPAFKPSPRSFTMQYTVKATLEFLLLRDKARTRLPYGVEALTRNPVILNDPQYRDATNLDLSPGFLLGVRDLSNQAIKRIATLSLPTMVVIPGQDIVCDPTAMRQAYERIPASTPKVCLEYPDFYHDILFEEGHSEIAQEVASWSGSLDSCSTSAASR